MGRARALVLVFSVTATLAGLSAAPVTAEPATSFRSRGVSAYAFWENCSRESCSYRELYAFDGTQKSTEEGPFKGTRVCLFLYSDARGQESGCVTAADGSLSVTKDLSSATLASVTVEVNPCRFDPEGEDFVCDLSRSRSVDVSARWVGRGSAATFSERYTFKNAQCSETYIDRGTHREARARAYFNGNLLRGGWGAIHDGMTNFRSTCEY